MNVSGNQTLSTPATSAKPLSSFEIQKECSFPPPERLRYYILGAPGNCKTEYLASIPDCIHIDPEDQRRYVIRGRSKAFVPKNGQHLADFLESLIADQARTYKHVGMDTLEKMVQVLMPWHTQQYNSTHSSPVADIRDALSGKGGWAKVNDYTNTIFQRLYAAGYGTSIAGHIKEERREANGVSTVVARPRINDGILGVLAGDAQFIWQSHLVSMPQYEKLKNAKGEEVDGKVVNVRSALMEVKATNTSVFASRYLKDRLGDFLPDSFTIARNEWGWDNWCRIYREACEKAIQKSKEI